MQAGSHTNLLQSGSPLLMETSLSLQAVLMLLSMLLCTPAFRAMLPTTVFNYLFICPLAPILCSSCELHETGLHLIQLCIPRVNVQH